MPSHKPCVVQACRGVGLTSRSWKLRPTRAKALLRLGRRQRTQAQAGFLQEAGPQVAQGARGGRGESRSATCLPPGHSGSIYAVWAPALSRQPQPRGSHSPHPVDVETKAQRVRTHPGHWAGKWQHLAECAPSQGDRLPLSRCDVPRARRCPSCPQSLGSAGPPTSQ